MKSVKFYFSLLIAAVMFVMPLQAQENQPAEPVEGEVIETPATEANEGIMLIDEAAEEIAIEAEAEVAAVGGGSQGRDNSAIDNEFSVGKAIKDFVNQAGFKGFADDWRYAVMILVSFVLLYLAIVKKFEPLLLMPIAFGMLLTNLPGAGMYHAEFFAGGHVHWGDFALGSAGFLD